MLHLAPEGVLAGPGAVPGDARRHRPQLRRGHRLPRPHASSGSASGSSSPASRTTSTPAGPVEDVRRRAAQPPPDRHPPAGHRPSTGTTPSSAAPAATRRRPGPRSASSPSATSSGSGTRSNQRPELWNLYNGRHRQGEHIRVFPLSNWTELDIWSLHRAGGHRAALDLLRPHARPSSERDGMLLAVHRVRRAAGRRGAVRRDGPLPHRRRRDLHRLRRVRGRHGVEVIAEVAAARITERGATRADDRISEAGMEDRKKEGYF